MPALFGGSQLPDNVYKSTGLKKPPCYMALVSLCTTVDALRFPCSSVKGGSLPHTHNHVEPGWWFGTRLDCRVMDYVRRGDIVLHRATVGAFFGLASWIYH